MNLKSVSLGVVSYKNLILYVAPKSNISLLVSTDAGTEPLMLHLNVLECPDGFITSNSIFYTCVPVRNIYEVNSNVMDGLLAGSIVVMILILVLIVIIIKLRETPVMKATSPLFNILALIGVALITLSVIARNEIYRDTGNAVTDQQDPSSYTTDTNIVLHNEQHWQDNAISACYAEHWLINMGYILLVTALFLKSW
jgi:glucan phosphoethanolaminetransferase (alkaline phosphatase superfamily)